MPIDPRFKVSGAGIKRDVRPWTVKTAQKMRQPDTAVVIFSLLLLCLVSNDFMPANMPDMRWTWGLTDLFLIFSVFYFRWFTKQLMRLPFKLPSYSKFKDPNNSPAGKSGPGKADGILFLGNVREGPMQNEELWLTDSDARTHILFLGTTGAGKTEGLKSLATNALTWGSGFVYVDGKAQNSLWGDIYSLARRFGRDDDLLVLNYMTGNSDGGNQSNTLNPFSIGSASYLTQMMVSMMDDSGEDNAMWKGRAIALMSALMPALTWKRDHQGLMMDVGVIRDNLTLQQIIKMSKDPALPDKIIRGIQSYLDALPGFVDSAFDDEGNERPPVDPNQPAVDLSQTRQQHGYLTMQFTRALQSLADEYGYIFKQQMADIDMMDVVLQRRILVVLIPALEKSPDEAANLGKIVVAALKGMMGATLGASIEGSKAKMLDNSPTESRSPFITIFDEVGYYTSPGMGVMAAQARSLGFSLVFASQDLPAMQKRVKEEAMSITGNCNLKIFGKLEDPTETRDFFEKTVSSALVSEISGYTSVAGMNSKSFSDSDNISVQSKKEAGYDDLRRQTQGQVHFLWADKVVSANFFHANPPRVNAIRVQRFLPVSNRNWSVETRDRAIADVAAHLKDPSWRAANEQSGMNTARELTLMAENFGKARAAGQSPLLAATTAVGSLSANARRGAADAVPANVGNQPDGYWPLGGADEPAAELETIGEGSETPPWLLGAGTNGANGHSSPQQPPAGNSGSPPWLTQASPAGSAPPQANTLPQGNASPPWLTQTPQLGGNTGSGAPPWMSAAPAAAVPAVNGAPPWMSAPPAAPQNGAPSWMNNSAPPNNGMPASGNSNGNGNNAGYSAMPAQPGAPLPPWAGGGMASAAPSGNGQPPAPYGQNYGAPPAYPQQPPQQNGGWGQGQGGNQPSPGGLPPWAGGGNGNGNGGYAPPPSNYPSQSYPQQQNYNQGYPPQGQPQQQPQPYNGYPPPQQPNGYPPYGTPPYAAPPQPAEMSPEIDAILRNAAENLAAEMFPEGRNPAGKAE